MAFTIKCDLIYFMDFVLWKNKFFFSFGDFTHSSFLVARFDADERKNASKLTETMRVMKTYYGKWRHRDTDTNTYNSLEHYNVC